MNWPMAIRVKITANTAVTNVDIMFSLMSWFMCRYLLFGMRPLRPVSEKTEKSVLFLLVAVSGSVDREFCIPCLIPTSQQFSILCFICNNLSSPLSRSGKYQSRNTDDRKASPMADQILMLLLIISKLSLLFCSSTAIILVTRSSMIPISAALIGGDSRASVSSFFFAGHNADG